MKQLPDVFEEFIEKNPPSLILNKQKLKDRKYLIETILGPSKKTNKEEQFRTIIYGLKQMEEDNPYIGGLITNACYRYQENPKKYKFIFPYIYDVWEKLINSVDLTKPIFTRWTISSSNTLGTLALSRNEQSKAKMIFEKSLERYGTAAHTPMLSMNLTIIYFQLAMIYLEEKKRDHSISLFERCYLLSTSSVNEIFNTRNPAVLSQKLDCDMLIEIGHNALMAKSLLSSIKIPKNKIFNSKTALKRFNNLESLWHKKIDTQINSERS